MPRTQECGRIVSGLSNKGPIPKTPQNPLVKCTSGLSRKKSVHTVSRNPKNTWENKEFYDKKANELADAFNKNFSQFAEFANQEILDAAPKATIKS